MSDIGRIERATQNRVIKLLKKEMEYRFLGNWHERENNGNIEESILRGFLTQKGYSNKLTGQVADQATVQAETASEACRRQIEHRLTDQATD